MKFKYTFKGTESNPQLVEALEGKVTKLTKLQMKPIESAECLFRLNGKNVYEIEVILHGGNGPLIALGQGDSFLDAIERVVEHLQKQMKRRKDKIQSHKV